MSQATGIFNLVKKLKWVVPLITVLVAAAAIGISVRRRKTALRLTIGGSIGLVAFLGGLHYVRTTFVKDAVKNGVTPGLSQVVFDTLLRFLKDGLIFVLVITLVLSLVLWLVGPARYAVALRGAMARAWRWVVENAKRLASPKNRSALSAGAQDVADWIGEHQSGLRIIGAVVAGIFIVFSSTLTFGGALIVLLLLAAYIGLIQLFVLWAQGGHQDGPKQAGEDTPAVEVAHAGEAD